MKWRSIANAPRDREVLFWIRPGTIDDGDYFVDTSGNPILAHVKPYFHLGHYGTWSSLMKATHWMPLPEPPP